MQRTWNALAGLVLLGCTEEIVPQFDPAKIELTASNPRIENDHFEAEYRVKNLGAHPICIFKAYNSTIGPPEFDDLFEISIFAKNGDELRPQVEVLVSPYPNGSVRKIRSFRLDPFEVVQGLSTSSWEVDFYLTGAEISSSTISVSLVAENIGACEDAFASGHLVRLDANAGTLVMPR